MDPGFARPWEGPMPDPGFIQPQPAYPPQPGYDQPIQQYAQPMADPRVAERQRLEQMAAQREAQLAATPGVLKARAQDAWERRWKTGKYKPRRD